MFHVRKALVVAASVALAACVASPADAAKDLFSDERGDIRSGLDIQTVQVKNNGAQVRVRVKVRDLDTAGRVAVYLNTYLPDRGPEFVMTARVGGAEGAGHYKLSKIRGWHAERLRVSCGGFRVLQNRERDVARFVVGRGCLSRAWDAPVSDLRVAANANVQAGKRDWAPRRFHHFPTVEHG